MIMLQASTYIELDRIDIEIDVLKQACIGQVQVYMGVFTHDMVGTVH